MSGYFGSFDLLPVFLGYNGVRAAAVYMPHPNTAYDDLRRRVRARSGCELVPVEGAIRRFPEVLESGGTVAIIADHHDERRGLPATFLGLPTRVSRSVGLLAWRYDADVVVAGNRRVGDEFAFAIEVEDVIKHEAWRGQGDADRVIRYITDRYLGALEALVRREPAHTVGIRTLGRAARPATNGAVLDQPNATGAARSHDGPYVGELDRRAP